MKAFIRKVGNSKGILIPATLLAESGIRDEIDLRLENGCIIIEPVRPLRAGWFDAYQSATDTDAWLGLPPEASEEWAW